MHRDRRPPGGPAVLGLRRLRPATRPASGWRASSPALRVSDGLDAAVATDDDIIGASAPAGFRPLRFGPFAADALALGW